MGHKILFFSILRGGGCTFVLFPLFSTDAVYFIVFLGMPILILSPEFSTDYFVLLLFERRQQIVPEY